MLADVESRVSSPVLVGRSGQLSALDAALAGAGRGQPSAIMVGGEAGVGKSRLVREFAARSRSAGARVLIGGCLELGADSLPFTPFTAVLRELVRDLGAAGVASLLPGGSSPELARLLPEFGTPAGQDEAGEARARLFEQMLLVLERLAEAGPVVLAIEDMHWADQSTRDLLAFLIRNQGSLDGVLIVVTYRSDDLHRTHPLRPLLAELDRVDWVTRMDLARLTRQDTGQLVAQLTGREPGDDLLTAVYRRAEGNPLFVEALVGNGEQDSGLPESLHDLFISAKTASVHVSNILAMLGVTSRGEAAATAHRHRLFDSFPADSPGALAEPGPPSLRHQPTRPGNHTRDRRYPPAAPGSPQPSRQPRGCRPVRLGGSLSVIAPVIGVRCHAIIGAVTAAADDAGTLAGTTRVSPRAPAT
jgi:hypothetical protein